MRQVARKGLITVAAASGVLAAASGYAYAGAGAEGAAAYSPGVASGNNVQVPVSVPVNACGNTVNVVGLLNPAMGNHCVQASGPAKGHGGGAHAGAAAVGSPGVASGNDVQAPVDVPVNACGNSIDVVGVANPAMGNGCATGVGRPAPHHPHQPQHPSQPHHPQHPHTPAHPKPHHPAKPVTTTPHEGAEHVTKPVREEPAPKAPAAASRTVVDPPTTTVEELAHTGADPLNAVAPAAALLLAGTVLYRRSRAGQR